jgi:hypothetical protein
VNENRDRTEDGGRNDDPVTVGPRWLDALAREPVRPGDAASPRHRTAPPIVVDAATAFLDALGRGERGGRPA